MPKTQKQLQSERTRQQIIDAAAQLFARKGFYGTSMADLASATSLTKGAFYHHFENKEALFFAVIQSVRDTWQQAVVRDVLQAKHALDRVATLLDNHAHLISRNPTLCLVIQGLMAEMEDTNPNFLAALQNVYTEMIEFIEQIITKGQARGQVRDDVDAWPMALNIVALLRGIGCIERLSETPVNCVEVMEALKPVLLDGLRPR